jgi:DnaJ-domain-containing protein 1
MTISEIVIVVGCALLGYWVVSSIIGSKATSARTDKQPVTDSSSSQDSRQQDNQYHASDKQRSPVHEEEHIPTSWFHILEVSESATAGEISAAYKKIISQYHPDKVATLGKDLRALAELKSKQINAAYDYALKLRG